MGFLKSLVTGNFSSKPGTPKTGSLIDRRVMRGWDGMGDVYAGPGNCKHVGFGLNHWQILAVDHMAKLMSQAEFDEWKADRHDKLYITKTYPVSLEQLASILAKTQFKVTDSRTGQRLIVQMHDNVDKYMQTIGVISLFEQDHSKNRRTYGYGDNMLLKPSAVDGILQLTTQELSLEGNRQEIVALTHATITKVEN